MHSQVYLALKTNSNQFIRVWQL